MGLSRFFLWGPNAFLVRWLPFFLTRAYHRLLGRLYYALNRHERDVIQESLRAVAHRIGGSPSLDPVVCRTFRGIFAHYSEKLFTAFACVEKVCRFVQKRTELRDEHLLEKGLTHGRGVILVTGHFGGVEFLPVILALRGYAVTMLVRFKTDRLKRALIPRGEALGITLVDAGNGERVLFTALQSLKANRVLITECDEFEAWRPAQRQWVEFLGCSCPKDRTLELLHRRYQSPVLMAFNRRVGSAHYRLAFHDLTVQGEGSERQSLQQRALRVLEQHISEAPDQWYQWKNLRGILGTKIFEKEDPGFVPEAVVSLGEDPGSAVRGHENHACNTPLLGDLG
jgi:lauroyl/myristoyl acyltransferase